MGDLTTLPQKIDQLIQSIDRLWAALLPMLHPWQPLTILLNDGIGLLLNLWFRLSSAPRTSKSRARTSSAAP